MEFFAIIIVLAAVQFWGSGGAIQQDSWFETLYRRLQALPAPWMRAGVAVALPVMVVLLLQAILGTVLFGIPLLILFVAVLLYSLGRGDFSNRLSLYLDCWRRGDLEGAYEHALTLDDFERGDKIDNARELHQAVRRALFYQGFERWFSVIFWFVLLGPAAAMAYRLLFLLQTGAHTASDDKEVAGNALFYTEWIPARILGFTFALVGNFDRCIGRWRDYFTEARPSAELLDAWGSLALSEPVPEGLVDGEQYSAAAAAELNAAQALLFRCLLCWVVVIALIQLV